MSIGSFFKGVCESIGKDNNPTYTVVAVATAKGIFRPFFTMRDKKESPETKKYTALREGLTEAIAIPTYLACSHLAGKGSALIKDADAAKRAKHNLRVVGVCVAALLVIPGLCSLVVKPFTDKIFHKNKDKADNQSAKLDITSGTEVITPAKPQVVSPVITGSYSPAFQHVNIANYSNKGMRVG